MCTALDYLHGIGIVHRDLKCENVLLSSQNQIKLGLFTTNAYALLLILRIDMVLKRRRSRKQFKADFGFARSIKANEVSKTFCGSAAYAAPELLQGIPYNGPTADIWSMGVILYIMICSSMPFRDNNIKTLLADQVNNKKC